MPSIKVGFLLASKKKRIVAIILLLSGEHFEGLVIYSDGVLGESPVADCPLPLSGVDTESG